MASNVPGELHILAFDHRAAMWSALGIADRADRDDICRDAKQLIWRGFLAARAAGVAHDGGAVLVDDVLGADVARAAVAAGVSLGMPVEASPSDGLTFIHGDDFGDALTDYRVTFAKVLVRTHPTVQPLNSDEIARLRQLDAWSGESGTPWMCEIIPPHVDGDARDLLAEIRPAMTVDVMNQFAELEVRPDLWKVEGGAATAGLRDLVAAGQRANAASHLIVLGQGADADAVIEWLRAAAGVDGFIGFAVGRTIFGEPLRLWLERAIHGDDVVERIASTYGKISSSYAATRDAAH